MFREITDRWIFNLMGKNYAESPTDISEQSMRIKQMIWPLPQPAARWDPAHSQLWFCPSHCYPNMTDVQNLQPRQSFRKRYKNVLNCKVCVLPWKLSFNRIENLYCWGSGSYTNVKFKTIGRCKINPNWAWTRRISIYLFPRLEVDLWDKEGCGVVPA